MDPPLNVALGQIAEAVTKEQCVLFLGAGVHAPPPEGSQFAYADAERPVGAVKLSELLAKQCELGEQYPHEDTGNLQRVSLYFERMLGRDDLAVAVRAAVQTDKRPSQLLTALAEIGFPLVITTNYDQLFEDALTTAGRKPRVSVYSPTPEVTRDYREPSAAHPVMFKIHGDIDLPHSMVITDDNYIDFILRMNDKEPFDPIPISLKSRLREWKTLFVGYSLLDYNLRVLFKTLRWRIDDPPRMYSVDYLPDPLIVEIWKEKLEYMNFIARDAWAVVPQLYERVLGKEFAPSPR